MSAQGFFFMFSPPFAPDGAPCPNYKKNRPACQSGISEMFPGPSSPAV
jgi:hypothetical protein